MSVPASAPSIFSASELCIAFGAHPILKSAGLAIGEGERIGLVGRNGSGKSTFLKIAAGVLPPDSGEIALRRGLTVGYLPQDFELEEDLSVQDAVFSGAAELQRLLAEYTQIQVNSSRSAELLHRIEDLDGWNIESRIRSILSNLHAPSSDRPINSLSGGEKRRVALCRALISKPDFLILDEPTNHIDTEAVVWLEEFLESYTGTCLFVTHDREFLDRVCNRIIELEDGQFYSYPGNYSDYLLAQAEREEAREKAEHRRQKFLTKELDWMRRAPGARRTKSVARINRYFEESQKQTKEAEGVVDIILPESPALGNRVISLRNVSFHRGEQRIIDGLTLELPAGVRIGVVGRNGAGKTTLLRLLAKELSPTSGVVEHGARTTVNYVDQHRIQIDPSKTVWDEVGEGRETVSLGTETVSLRAYLRRFLFREERITRLIHQLSGGERSRVLLAKILKRGGNVLLLDEPTNDLDFQTLRLLEEALLAFPGTIVTVSHDRFFLNRICTHTLFFENDGRVVFDAGSFDECRGRQSASERNFAQSPGNPASQSPAPLVDRKQSRPIKLTWKEQKELEGIEALISQTESELSDTELLFSKPDFYEKHGNRAVELERECAELRKKISGLYQRWEELEQKTKTT